jgi:hypothetical protein
MITSFLSIGDARVPDAQTRQVVPVASTESAEEERLRVRIEELRGRVAVVLAETAQLGAQLGVFEARYDARIGVPIVETLRYVKSELAVVGYQHVGRGLTLPVRFSRLVPDG